jgi:diguanylate cyclase (GGDEF)-like protein
MEKEEACLILLFWDIDRQKKEELEQRLLNQKYEMMEMLSREYPFDLDVKNWVMLRSHRLMELRGHFEVQDEYYPVDEEILTLCPPDQQPFLNAMKLAAQSEQEGSIDTRFNLSEDGEVPRYLWFRTYYKSVTDTEGNIVRIIGRSFNVDTDKALQDEVRRDPLTKVLNKMEVQQEIDDFFQGEPGGTHIIFLLDIDNFKGVNDHFGHTFGDSVIIEVADLIKSQFRMNDVIGRVGGDEFLVLMKNSSLEKAEEKAETLCQLLAKEYTGGEVHYHITISAGLAVYGVDGSDYSSLFEKADHALYRAKQAGKNGYEVATRNDIGPIVRNIRTIEQRENISAEDHNFLTFAFNLMAHAKNLDGSLNMLLKRLAEQYQLDLVTVFENDALHKTMTMTNYFGSDYNFYEESVFTEIHPTVNELQPGNYVIIDQDAFTDRYKVKARIKSTAPVDMERSFSAVVGKFEYIGNQTGEIFYIRMGKEPTWQKGELEMFQELTRTIAIFVSLRFRMDESEAQIRYIQNRDQLTKLYNQEAFRKVMNEFMQQTDPDKVYALEYLDINNFGYINDNYGYKVGDNVLKMFAKDASEQPSFCAGCRLYSDFFLILTTDRDADTVIANLQSQSRRFSNMQNHQYPNSGMGVTAGVYIIEDTKMDVDVAIENANLAWKYAKNSGRRDIVVYDATQRSRRADEQKVIGEFFEALYRDDFQMYLQPKFILGDRTVYGAEALARWKRPDGQILAPAYFIDSLEKIGYITELDFYIFEEVLKTLDKWDKQKKRKIVISTNFSGRHFDTDGEEFLNRIQHIMSKYTVSPQYIEIEVTEGVLIENIDVLEYCMNRLHEMGFRVAIDDFGTGYSSLSVLADMPADVVKIDKSFINKDMTDRKMSLLYEIGRMVKILNKDIIIEGVETQEQEQFLKEGGFTCGQGYLCNKPIPIGQFERLYL